MGDKILKGKETILGNYINGVAFADLKGNLTYVNDSFIKMWGYDDSSEILGKKAVKLWHEEKKALEIIKTVKEKGEWIGELIALKKDASAFPVQLTANMIKNKLRQAYIMASFVDITDHKRVEEELAEYRTKIPVRDEENLRKFYKGIPIPTYTWQKKEKEFVLIDYNNAAESFLGKKTDYFSGKTLTEIYGDRPEVLDNFWQCFKGKTSVKNEGFLTLKSTGKTKHFSFTYTFVPPDFVIVHTENIDRRKRAEEELHQSEDNYRFLYNSMSEGVALNEIIYDKSGDATDYKIVDVNSSYERILGLKKENVIGNKASQIYNTGTPPYLEIYSKVADSGKSICFEAYFFQVDKYFSISAFSPQKGQFATVFTDISRRKQMERTLRESEEKHSTLIEQAKDGVVIVQDEVYQFANQAAVKIIGCATNKLLGKSYLDILAPESRDEISQRYNLCLAGKKIPHCYETKTQCKDGTIKDTDVSISRIQYNGRPAIMAIIRDNTKRKKMEMELQKAQKLESIGTLAGGIAHDFNNLLTGIIGNLSLAKLYTKSEDQIFSILTEAEKASCQAKKLTQEFLFFSKGGELIKKDVSILKLLNNMVELSLSGSKSICKLSLPDDLLWAQIDEGQMIQALNNIISNAEQSMAGGGVITLRAENSNKTDDTMLLKDALLLKGGKFVKITIKDKGVGIPEGYLDKIFDPYFTTKQKGSGLGLAITYGIIKKHGGYITVESTLGVGTIFTIYLPAIEKEVFTVKNIEEDKFAFGKGKILFMDDQKIIRDMIKHMLIHLGYEVEFAKDGAEAIVLYEKAKESGQSFNGVILDLTVPGGMGGKEAIKKLLEIDPKAKAIVSSGYFNDPIMSDYKQYGFKGVVAKPYQINELNEALQNVLIGVKEQDEDFSHSFEMTSL